MYVHVQDLVKVVVVNVTLKQTNIIIMENRY